MSSGGLWVFSWLELGLKLVAAGAYRIDSGVVFHSEELHALGFGGGFAGFGDGRGVLGRNENLCRGIRRHRDIDSEIFTVAFPPAADRAPRGLSRDGLNPAHVPY